jgi:hypothetical protein
MVQVYPKYFGTLGIPLVAGRDFYAADNAPETGERRLPAAIVNEAFARQFLGGTAAAVGRRITMAVSGGTFEIVGVAGDVRDQDVRDAVMPAMYATYTQTPTGRGQMTLLVRTVGDPAPVAASVQSLARAVDPAMPVPEIETVADRVNDSIAQERLLATLATLFGAVGLMLASIGLYGVVAYSTIQRKGEFGVRMALGATRAWVMRTVIRDTLQLVAGGIAVGVAATVALSGIIAERLFGVTTADPLTIAAAVLLLAVVATLAAVIPALRASRVAPLAALRGE